MATHKVHVKIPSAVSMVEVLLYVHRNRRFIWDGGQYMCNLPLNKQKYETRMTASVLKQDPNT